MPFAPYEFDAERFSRWMSYVLRHNPARYGLLPDRHGYVDLEEFLSIAKRRYHGIEPEHLRGLIESSGSGRFEIAGSRLRARYGHSIAVEPVGPPVAPPARLYHGTDSASAEAILLEGLKPLGRQLIHLSETLEDAQAVAGRKVERPVILRVLAHEAHVAGIAFFREGKVYLVSEVPPQFLGRESLGPAAGRSPSPSAAASDQS